MYYNKCVQYDFGEILIHQNTTIPAHNLEIKEEPTRKRWVCTTKQLQNMPPSSTS